LSRVEIETIDGGIIHGMATPAPGHPKRPFTDADLAAKLRENIEPFAGPKHTKKLAEFLFSIEHSKSVPELTALLALDESSDIDFVHGSDHPRL
jgi:2-methylcitrate dehydratase